MVILPNHLRLVLLVLASVGALLIATGRANADAGLSVIRPVSGAPLYVNHAGTVAVEWSAINLSEVAGGADSPKITFMERTGAFSRTVRISKTVSFLVLPATATRSELAARNGIVSIESNDWTDGPFLPAGTYHMTMTVFDPLNVGAFEIRLVSNIRIIGLCIPSTYSSDGYEPCTAASPGHYVDTPGATSELPCEPGLFMNLAGAWRCVDSPRGYFVAGFGATLADPCPAGSYQPEPGQIACLLAPAGSFAAVAGAEQATLCAAGSYQPQAGQVDCLLAPENTYVDSSPPVSIATCPDGTTSEQGSASLADCIDRQVLMDKSVRPPCRVAMRRVISAPCVAKSLNVSLVGARAVVLRLVGTKQASCRAVSGRIKTIAAGSCKVVLVVRPKHGQAVTHRASVTVTR